jgi:chaperonin GroES
VTLFDEFCKEDNMGLIPLGDRLVVKREGPEEKTAGGIIIPDTAKDKPMQGKVVAVGEGALNNEGKRIPMNVKAGDLVLFGKWTGTEVKFEGEDYLILKESDLFAKIA